VPKDGALNYSFNVENMHYETVRFNRKAEGGVINFVLLHSNQEVTVTMMGKTSKSYILKNDAKQAMLAASNLSAVLSDITRLLNERRLAQAKLDYIYRKQNHLSASQSNVGN